jgi:hypothetical protein
LVWAETGVGEDGGRVECDDVDTAHLLGNHDSERSEGRTANTGNGEELDETGNVVALADDFLLDFKLRVDIV